MFQESDWQKALAQLTDDLDGKLDRLEFGPFRDELEKQLKALKAKLKGLDLSGLFGDGDDAAGLRKYVYNHIIILIYYYYINLFINRGIQAFSKFQSFQI